MANTNILIKRAGVGGAGRPSSLLAGELAYSYASNTIFIGSPTGDGVVNVGGQYYTSQIDNATNAATGSTLVRRDASGNASFNFITANIIGEIIGNANSATQLQTARNFSIDGGDITAGAISFNGTGDVVLNASLDTVPNLGAGTYGSTTAIPVIQVAANGRVMNVTTAAISTSFTVAGDTGTPQTVAGGDTLTLAGGAGITSTASATDTVTFDVDDTVVRANAFTGGTQTINTNLTIGANNDLTVTGNLFVFGNTTTLNIEQFEIQDPLLLLGIGNYFSDTFDIGFASHYNDGSNAHTGLIRDAGTKEYHFFDGYTSILDANNNINLSDPSYHEANVHAQFFKGNTIGNTVQANTIYVANRIFGDTSNNTLLLAPSVNYGPGVNDQYIVLDPTAPNHIHVRAGGNIDASTAELYLGGEQTNVNVSDTTKEVYIRANNTYVATFANNGTLSVSSDIISGGRVLAAQGAGATGGFSFTGTEGDNDSGMFSNADGNVHFYADSTDVAYFAPDKFQISKPTYLTAINKAATGNVVYYNAETGELTYDVDNSLTPTSIANGAYSLYISSTDGMLVTNGAGLQLANGAIIKDTAGDAVAFGQNAGVITQGVQAVAIGDSAGYNNQAAYGVAIGYGAGNVNQGTTAVAIGINAGISNQGAYGIAIGNSAGSAQGQYSIALGYDSGGSQGTDSVAIGTQAAKGNTSSVGANSVLIGKKAGFESAAASSIILNATGNDLSSATSGFFVNPVRYSTSTNESNDLGLALYNQSTKEFKYTYALDGGSF
jgi:hypothetical protein